MFDELIKY